MNEMNNSALSILSENLHESRNDIVTEESQSIFKLFLNVFSAIICSVTFGIMTSLYNKDKLGEKYFIPIATVLIFVICYVIIDLFIFLYSYILSDASTRFTYFYITNAHFLLKVTIFSLVGSILLKQIRKQSKMDKAIENVAEEAKPEANEIMKMMESLKSLDASQYLMALFVFCIVMVIASLIVYFICFRIHRILYKERIIQDEKKYGCVKDLNKKTGVRFTANTSNDAAELFEILTEGNRSVLGLSDFIRNFGSEKGEEMFLHFDIDKNGSVTKEEFIQTYTSILNEGKRLRAAIINNSQEISKLKIIVYCAFFPLALFLGLLFLKMNEYFKTGLAMIGVVTVPLGFMLNGVASEIFHTFIYVYLVRPFDVGDTIELDGRLYDVHEVGFLYTTFLLDSKYHIHANNKLREKAFSNLRRSEHITAEYTKSIKYEGSLKKISALKEYIKIFLKENRKLYEKRFTISNYKITNRGQTMEITIKIILKCPYNEIDESKKRKDKFELFLHDAITKNGIEYS
ncbi:Mechanosensitive ion channel [Spraguea lophii 42_110]|uniref:Mechanosensitive ion channel n=1 Tax=Spraguea lophii (strain 42_110) TaxID=1358809 RepID=S7W9I7_SPRLO|nr:Mechanosensitive ion channel [Spraguea lophii 42_110]